MKPHGVFFGAAALAASLTIPSVAAHAAPTQEMTSGTAASAHSAPAAAPDIPIADVMGHLRQLQDVASANGGTRAAGTSGYQQSLEYVRSQLEAAGLSTRVQEFSYRGGTSYNLIATYDDGTSSDEVVMVGAHLDSVRAGPGINDNASGTGAVLETALTIAERGVDPQADLRFAWWGAEELGLVGSQRYVQSLSSAELAEIEGYLNADMVGSPNAGYFVYGGENRASEELKAAFTDYFSSIEVPTEGLDINGRSDHAPFLRAGVPAAGVSTGAGARKTRVQAQKWGGTAGRAFDPCYHQACDTINNINQTALDRMSDAFASAVWELAVGPGGEPPPEQQAPTAAFTSSCDQLACDFDGSGSSDPDGSIASYEWSFGDGSTGSGATVSHTYDSAGSYEVTLTVTDNDGNADSVTRTISPGGGNEEPPDMGTWEPYTSYQVGDQVTYSSQTYECQQAHTSMPGWEPSNTPALWQLV